MVYFTMNHYFTLEKAFLSNKSAAKCPNLSLLEYKYRDFFRIAKKINRQGRSTRVQSEGGRGL